MHVEAGFIRCIGDVIEMVVSHPFGLCKISQGKMSGDELIVGCDESGLFRTSTASGSRTTAVRRTYRVKEDVLKFSMEMATDIHPQIQTYLVCVLKRKE